MKRYVLRFFLALGLLGMVVGCAPKGAEEIKVGTAFPRSGPIAMLGEQAWKGADLARRMVNEEGGVKGKQVVFVDADAPDPQAAVTEAERLISKEGVPVIIGSLTSGNALAMAPIAERNGAILWETSGISDDITKQGYRYVFRTCDRGGVRGRAAIEIAVDTLAPMFGIPADELRVAMVYEDSAYGTSQYEGALEEMEFRGLSFVLAEGYSNTATDLSSLVLRLQDANPDIILGVGYINDAQLFCNQLREYGVIPKVLVGGGAGYTDPQFEAGQGAFANGVLGLDMPTNLSLDVLQDPEVRALAEQFRERYAKEYGEEPPLAAEVVFMGTYSLLHDVLPQAASLEPEEIRKAAMSVQVEETIMGWSVEFDDTGQNVGAVPVAYQWQDGTKVIVWPDRLAGAEMKYLPLGW